MQLLFSPELLGGVSRLLGAKYSEVLASVLFVLLLYQMVSGQCVMVVPCAAVCGLFVCNSLESSHNHISSLVLGRSCMIADAACLSFSSGWCIFQSHRRF